jgi:hypothetical protein
MRHFRPELKTPESDLATLSACAPDLESLAAWMAALPMANTVESAKQLHRTTSELARLSIDSSLRSAMLEALRPPVHYVCARLDRNALGSQHAGEGLAQLSQSLQHDLVNGYKALIRDATASANVESERELVGLAIHRAISDLSRMLLRSCQFFTSTPKLAWLELNQLLLLAEHLDLCDAQYTDEENHGAKALSVRDTYLRVAMLATARPNQLRHKHLNAVFTATELWCPRLSLDAPSEDALFTVNLSNDTPPRYRSLGGTSKDCRGIRTDLLVYELEAHLNEIATDVPVPEFVDTGLLRHLVHAWGVMKRRSFRRTRADGPMKVCVGLRTVHYYISGGVEFAEQLGTTDALLKREIDPFGHGTGDHVHRDVWHDAAHGHRIPENPDIGDPARILRRTPQPRETELKYPCHDVEIVDTSPGGYGVRWRSTLPSHLQPGELVAIREADDKRWCIGVARWITHSDADTLVGLELLAPRAIPVALRIIQKRGSNADHSRALLLPALEAIGQAAMLITARVPFQEGQKVLIQRSRIHAKAQLMRRVRITESFSQFTFRMLDGYLENAPSDLNMDVLWETIGDDEPEASQ